jgi:hypothetical protein
MDCPVVGTPVVKLRRFLADANNQAHICPSRAEDPHNFFVVHKKLLALVAVNLVAKYLLTAQRVGI